MKGFDGNHAVVTGAGSGIGKAITELLAAQGAKVTLMGRGLDALERTAARLPVHAQAQCIVCDVADPKSIALAFGQAREGLGTVTILVNNAGQAKSAPFEKISIEHWQDMLAVNLTGTFLCTQAVLPYMLIAGTGRIVNIASTAGQRGYPYVAGYVAAKHGVVGLTRALARELATSAITANAVCPGYTDTDLVRESVGLIARKTGRSDSEAMAEFLRSNPQGRLITPAEVAATVAWLCTAEAASITGQSISVSGGEVT